MKKTSLLVASSLLLGIAVAGEGNAGKNAEKPNPLAALPGKPGPHLAKIAAMGDNSWINLGQAAQDNRFPRKTVACGRAWASKMAFATELGGAFFCGTGSHGAVPQGYYMDDLWFYDANAHRWICLYPGATKDTRLKLDANNFEVTLEGKHNPVSYLSHAYSNTTYAAHVKKYMMIHRPCPWWAKALPQRGKWLGIPEGGKLGYNTGKLNKNCRHPVFWDVTANRWDRDFVKEPGGPEKSFCGVLEYIPSRKQALNIYHGTTWYYDFEARKWNGTGAKKGPSGYDANSCFDPKTERVYLAKGDYFQAFDTKTNTWHDLKTEGQPANLGCTNGDSLHFDTVNGVVLWHGKKGPIVIYDPAKKTWTDLGKTEPKIPWKRYNPVYMLWHGFYHPGLNVHLFYRAGDSGLNDATWLAYRYKRKP
ncbi:MAG: hypothetical protein ACYTGB_18570 [Planctomycetota bacterium]